MNSYFYHTDHLGSTTYLTGPTGSVVEHEEYTPWGEMWFNNQNPNFENSIPNYFFTGKELDLTGLYYFGARYYDPMTSLWCSPDPILRKYLEAVGKGNPNSMNFALYSYGHQNPVIMFDPDGKVAVGYQVRQNDQSFLVIVESHDGKIKTYEYNLTENAPLVSKTGEKYGTGAKMPPKQYEMKGREVGGSKKIPNGYPVYTNEGAGSDAFITDNGTIRTESAIHAGSESEACPLLGKKSPLTDKQKAEIQGIYDRNKNDGGFQINLYEYPSKENTNNETPH